LSDAVFMTGLLSRLKDGTAFQVKFKDREGAGEALGIALKFVVKKSGGKKVLVLGILRGGVIVADVIARKLNADFDVVIARKLTAPDNKENAIGAVMPDGSTYLDEFLVNSLKVPPGYIEEEKSAQLQEIKRRIQLYRPRSAEYDISGRTVVLVDDGIATGATVIAAARWLKRQGPAKLVIAAPVAQPQAVELLKSEADAVEVISTPANFGSVNQFYKNFDQATDERVLEILKNRGLL
jgi:putative phosphoribosyl transferase